MDCSHYERLLIDVAYGEQSAEVAQARAHAATCASCAKGLETLQRGLNLARALPLAEPSSHVSEIIMERARAHALAARTLSRMPVEEPSQSLVDRVREFLVHFAMGRQVAMATVMVLVVAVGLWFVPRTRQHELASGNVVNPDPDGEAGPSSGIVPAAPLDLDLRQGRIRARSEEPLARRPRELSAANEGASEPSPQPELRAKEVVATADMPTEVSGAARTEQAAANEPTPQASERESDAKGRAQVSSPRDALSWDDEAKAPAAARSRDESEPSPAPATTASTRSMAIVEESAGFAPPPMAPRRAPSPSVGSGVGSSQLEALSDEAVAAPEARKGSDPLTRGTDSFREGNYPDAIQQLETASRTSNGQLPTSARLSLARSYQRTGRCADAVVHYETFLQSAPRNRDVMLEAAACYRQLDRQGDASRWVARANALTTSTPAGKPKSSVQKAEPTTPAQ